MEGKPNEKSGRFPLASGEIRFANLLAFGEIEKHLRQSARFLGTRYGLVEVGPLTVPARQIDQPVQIARADVLLPT